MQPRSVVPHANRQRSPRRPNIDVDSPVRSTAGVFDRIIDQIREDLIDDRDVGAHPRQSVPYFDNQLHAGLLGPNREPRHQPSDEVLRRDDLVPT